MPIPSLNLNLSNFSPSLNSVLLENISSFVDLCPLGSVEKVQLEGSPELVNVNGLGKNNKIVKSCRNIRDLSALRTVPRVIIDPCSEFINCEDLNQVHYLTIRGVLRDMDFSGFRKEKGCRVHRLELLECYLTRKFHALDEIPFLKITAKSKFPLQSLEGLGGK
jgi:hypothetical protein